MNTELFQHYARQVNPLQWEIAMRIETVTSLRPWQISLLPEQLFLYPVLWL